MNKRFQIDSKKYKNLKMKLNFKESIEPQEIFLDNLSKKKYEEIGVSEKRFEVLLSKRILKGLYFLFLILIFVLFGKTFQLQMIQGEDFSELSEKNKFIVSSLKAQRGVIYDRNFNQLVFNRPNFSLICDKRDLSENETEKLTDLIEISKIIDQDYESLKEKINKSSSFEVLISENIDYQTLILLKTRIKEFSGFEVISNTIREYKDGKHFSHLIGYNRETGEKIGLEKFYNEVLKEKPGEFSIMRDATGNLISEEIISLPEPGKNLILWLDIELQKKIEEELRKSMENVGSEKAVVVALDPKTGGVLSLVSIPNFDNNSFSQSMSVEEWKEINDNKNKPFFNRAISAVYPTGSIIKPLIALAALEEKIISEDEKILCKGKIEIPNPWDKEIVYTYNDWSIHGWTDVRKAIAESCNVFFYTIGGGYKNIDGLGVERIKKYLELFGWGNKTNIDISGEKKGFIPDKEWKKSYFKDRIDKTWMPGDTYNLSIGQGYIEVTPLQVAVAFSSIANQGTLYEPRVVQKIIDNDGNLIKSIESKIIRQNFINPENFEIVKQGMRQTVTNGSATRWLDSLSVKSAAKTGTAQISKKGYYHNWVTVFAPYDDPEIVLTVIIESVKGDRVAALPVAKGVLDWYFNQAVVDSSTVED